MDDIDATTERLEREQALLRPAPYVLPAGTPGECDGCGNDSPRLIGGFCGGCRDKRRMG